MLDKKWMVLAIFFISLVAISGVSAAEDAGDVAAIESDTQTDVITTDTATDELQGDALKASADDEVAMNKTVEVYFPDDDETETYRIVTTIRGNTLKGLISIDSPLGKALMHRHVGETVHVRVGDGGYDVEIRSISEAADEAEDEIRSF